MDGVTDEFALIAHLTSRLRNGTRNVRIGIGDDAAVLSPQAGAEWLVTTDAMVAGTHFLPQTMSWADVGYKVIAASLSDIAAMGGDPQHIVLSLAIPKDVSLLDLEQLYAGVDEICTMFDCALVGGDVVTIDGPMVLTSTVLGTCPAGTALLRSGAQPGDLIYLTGTVGGSAAGLRHLLEPSRLPEDEALQLRHWHQRPRPQVAAGRILRESGASSCNDISDGLASELNEISTASQVRLRVDTQRVPLAPAVSNFARMRGEAALDYAWYGGEDYQLVGTASPLAFARALAICESIGVQLTNIGRVEAGDGVVTSGPDGRLAVLAPRGYNHFRSDGTGRG